MRASARLSRHPWLDQSLVPLGAPLQALAATVMARVEAREAATGARARARRPADQRVFRELVDITTANLARAVLEPPPSVALAARFGKLPEARTRYENPAFGKQFRPLLDRLEELGLVALDLSTQRGAVSNLKPTAEMAALVWAAGVTPGDFGRHPDDECILLTRKIERDGGRTRHRTDYDDTATTHAMRADLRRLNDFLEAADLAFIPDGLAPEVNTRDRRLTRYFLAGPDGSPRFDRGGRLFGGWWVNLAARRRHAIRIDGEPVADLDFSSMFVRLAYAHLGKTPPAGDLYALPGFEDYRSGVKLAMNTLFWDQHRTRKEWPREMGVGVGDDVQTTDPVNVPGGSHAGLLPAGWGSVARLTKAILERHEGLREAFGRGIGAALMFRESEVMMAVLGRLMEQGTTALPLHDGLMVARSLAPSTKALMEGIAREMTGAEFPVREKHIGSRLLA